MRKTTKMLGPKPGKEHLLVPVGSKPATVAEGLAGMKGGESRSGFLGGGNIVRKPDYEPIPDSIVDLKAKRLIQKMLAEIIEPNPLSAKSTVEMDRRSLVQKLNKSSLGDLKRFLPLRLRSLTPEELEIITVTEEEKAEIQDFYKDCSP